MSFLDTGSRNDVFPRCRLAERCLSQIKYHGKTFYRDMISRKVILPRYDNQGKTSYQAIILRQDFLPRYDIAERRLVKVDITERCFAKIGYLRKTSCQNISGKDVFSWHHYLGQTSCCDIMSWKAVFLRYHILVRRLSMISYLGNMTFRDIISR